MRDACSRGVTAVAAGTGSCAVAVVVEVVGLTLAVGRRPAEQAAAAAIAGYAVERQLQGQWMRLADARAALTAVAASLVDCKVVLEGLQTWAVEGGGRVLDATRDSCSCSRLLRRHSAAWISWPCACAKVGLWQRDQQKHQAAHRP